MKLYKLNSGMGGTFTVMKLKDIGKKHALVQPVKFHKEWAMNKWTCLKSELEEL